MTEGIFLIERDGSLTQMREEPYDSERLLQGLLSSYPQLLLGGVDGADGTSRLLLVKAEMAVPSEEDGADRWSLDHLFLDRDGVPTLVEVKRSSDTRIRREVVGQMLDYAANAVVYWPVERLVSAFEATAKAAGASPDDVLQGFLGGTIDAEAFWQRVKLNLQAGRIRMLFVADVIPMELRRIVEFLNEQMDPAEVLAVEIRQYTGSDKRSLVPRVLGQTAEAQRKKGPAGPSQQWTEERFLATLAERDTAEESRVARRILDWAHGHGLRIFGGKGLEDGSLYPMLDVGGRTQYTFAIITRKSGACIQFQFPYHVAPFETDAARAKLVADVNAALGADFLEGAKFPSVLLSQVADNVEALLAVFDRVIEATNRASNNAS